MAKKETTNHAAPVLPMLKTVEQMSISLFICTYYYIFALYISQ